MDYKKLWRTLKAESGYRETKDIIGQTNQSVKCLMENIENRKNVNSDKHLVEQEVLALLDETIDNEVGALEGSTIGLCAREVLHCVKNGQVEL